MPFFVRGNKTCRDAWKGAHGINNKRLDDALKSFVSGVVRIDLEGPFGSLHGPRHKTNIAKAWMRLFF